MVSLCKQVCFQLCIRGGGALQTHFKSFAVLEGQTNLFGESRSCTRPREEFAENSFFSSSTRAMLRSSLRACSRLLAPRVPPFSPAGSARGLCAVHAKAPPPASPRLYQLPPLSSRKQRLQQQGLVGLSAESVRMEQGPKRATEDSFRVQNYNVTLKKPAEFALTAVYGYGRSRSKQLAASVGIFGHYPLYRMRESQREYIRRELNAACIAYDSPGDSAGAALQKEVGLNIQRLKEIGCYRGARHRERLPLRGGLVLLPFPNPSARSPSPTSLQPNPQRPLPTTLFPKHPGSFLGPCHERVPRGYTHPIDTPRALTWQANAPRRMQRPAGRWARSTERLGAFSCLIFGAIFAHVGLWVLFCT